MDQLNYYTINRHELNQRILVDEINKVNLRALQQREFVNKNNVFHK